MIVKKINKCKNIINRKEFLKQQTYLYEELILCWIDQNENEKTS